MWRDSLKTVAHLVVKSTRIIIPWILSFNPASDFVIAFISCQGHNSGEDSNGAIRAKVHELFRISDRYRWGSETRRDISRWSLFFLISCQATLNFVTCYVKKLRAFHQNEDP